MLDSNRGLYVMAARDIFQLLKNPEYQNLAAWVSFYEIYQGHLYDLLNSRQRLYAREDGKQNVCIAGLKEFEVNSVDRLMQIFEHGSNTRSTGNLERIECVFVYDYLSLINIDIMCPFRCHWCERGFLPFTCNFSNCSQI
jgi:Kinesin motor domain